MSKSIALTLFLFLFIFLSTPALAYESIDLNLTNPISTVYGNSTYGMDCTNNSGTLYCYVAIGNVPTLGHYYIYRFNSTWGDAKYCEYAGLGAIYGMAMINSTMVGLIPSNGGLFGIDITNIATNTTCDRYTLGSTGISVYPSQIGTFYPTDYASSLFYFGANGIYDSSNGTKIYDTWADAVSTPLPNIRFPTETDNNTAYASDMSWTAYGQYNNSNFYKVVNGDIVSQYQNPFLIYGLPLFNNPFVYDFYKIDESTTWLYVWHSNVYRMNWTAIENTTYYQDCNWNSEPIGTSCDTTDSSHRIYKTNIDNCNVEYGSCPSGTLCSQLTPQINVTNDLVENLTDCQIHIGGLAAPNSLKVNCINVCFWGNVIYSTCYADECKVCPDDSGGITVNDQYGIFTNTYYSNQSSISVPTYTISCINTTTGGAAQIIDNYGNNTTVINILTQAGNNVTQISPDGCFNTSTTCYDSSCNQVTCYSGGDNAAGLRTWVNAGMGTPYGTELIALIMAAISAFVIWWKSGMDKMEAFIVPFMVVLAVFAMPGIEFFPSWFLLLQTFFVAVFVFFKVRG